VYSCAATLSYQAYSQYQNKIMGNFLDGFSYPDVVHPFIYATHHENSHHLLTVFPQKQSKVQPRDGSSFQFLPLI
jgi:hypothetical protein